MADFLEIDSCLNHIFKSVNKVAKNEVVEKMEDLLEKTIKKTVYKRPPSVFRTGAFLRSVDSDYSESNNGAFISVFNNPDNMDTNHESLANWNGIPIGSSMNEYIGNFLNNGHGGIYSYQAQGFYSIASGGMPKLVKGVLKKNLKQYGITMR